MVAVVQKHGSSRARRAEPLNLSVTLLETWNNLIIIRGLPFVFPTTHPKPPGRLHSVANLPAASETFD